MKTCEGGGGAGDKAPSFLISALDGIEWSVSRLSRFTPGERAPGTHWIGDWVGPRAEEENRFPCPNPGRPFRNP
jgi:hypothetical protein